MKKISLINSLKKRNSDLFTNNNIVRKEINDDNKLDIIEKIIKSQNKNIEEKTEKNPKTEKRNETEIKKLKEYYYLKKNVKKRQNNNKNRHKLIFEWDNNEDTTYDKFSIFNTSEKKETKIGIKKKKSKILTKKTNNIKKEKLLTKIDYNKIREENNIKLKQQDYQQNTFPIITKFSESLLYKKIKRSFKKSFNYNKPTPVQMQVIPLSLKFKDILCIAPTGSGKTLSFLLPLLNFLITLPKIKKEKSHLGPYALVIAPTRELVQQIKNVFDKLISGFEFSLRGEAFVGGYDSFEQSLKFMDGIEIIFATVGKCKDLLKSNFISLNQCYYVIVDEADKMIEKNTEEFLEYILDHLDHRFEKSEDKKICEKQEDDMVKGDGIFRVTQFFSATMKDNLKPIINKYLKNYIDIRIEKKINNKVEYKFEYLGLKEVTSQKNKLLLDYIKKSKKKILIFFNTKLIIEKVSKYLKKNLIQTIIYNSDLTQNEREKVISNFRKNQDIMLATDIAGRGLDIENLFTIINYDVPLTFEKFVHRAGRTGRAGKEGCVISFIGAESSHLIDPLVKFLNDREQKIPFFLKKNRKMYKKDYFIN